MQHRLPVFLRCPAREPCRCFSGQRNSARINSRTLDGYQSTAVWIDSWQAQVRCRRGGRRGRQEGPSRLIFASHLNKDSLAVQTADLSSRAEVVVALRYAHRLTIVPVTFPDPSPRDSPPKPLVTPAFLLSYPFLRRSIFSFWLQKGLLLLEEDSFRRQGQTDEGGVQREWWRLRRGRGRGRRQGKARRVSSIFWCVPFFFFAFVLQSNIRVTER